jgi:peptidyl-tRNA hydrolase
VQPAKGKPKRVESFVIKNFSKDEEKIITEIMDKALSAIETALTDGIDKAMNLYN